MSVPEAGLEQTEFGLVPSGEGWFVVNAREARWRIDDLGAFTASRARRASSRSGSTSSCSRRASRWRCTTTRTTRRTSLCSPARRWRSSRARSGRCGSGTCCIARSAPATSCSARARGPCVLLAIGSRSGGEDWGAYPVDETALRHGASVEQETTKSEGGVRAVHDAHARDPLPGGLAPGLLGAEAGVDGLGPEPAPTSAGTSSSASPKTSPRTPAPLGEPRPPGAASPTRAPSS